MDLRQISFNITEKQAKQISKELFEFRYSSWIVKNQNNPDATDYERAFDLMMQEFLNELIQLSSGPAPL